MAKDMARAKALMSEGLGVSEEQQSVWLEWSERVEWQCGPSSVI